MRHHYNLIAEGGGVVVRDIPWYDASTIIKGQALTYGATTLGSCLIDATATAADVAGVSNETVTCSTTAITTGTLVHGKTIINPDAIYLAQCDPTASVDVDVVSATTTAITLGATDDDMDGSWIYCNSGTGIGQLGYIGAASTTVMTLDTTDAFAVAPDATTDVLLIRRPWLAPANGGRDLDTTFSMLLSDEDETGAIMVLENYIEATTIPFGPLRPRQHHALTGLNGVNVKFWSDIQFQDNLFMTGSQA